MYLYFKIIQNNSLIFFQYKSEMIAHVLKKVITPIFFVLLWYVISQSSEIEIDMKEIISYYLIASGVNQILMARWGDFSSILGKQMIKQGNLNSLLIKPVNPALYTLAIAIGKSYFGYILSILFIVLGLIINPPLSIFAVFSGILFMIVGFCVSYAFNIFESAIFFYVPDGDGFRSTINHIKSLLGGLYIPLKYFPINLKSIVEVLPFSTMIYLPTIAFRFNEPNLEFFKFLIISLIWAIVLNILSFYFWKFSLRRYDAVGI